MKNIYVYTNAQRKPNGTTFELDYWINWIACSFIFSFSDLLIAFIFNVVIQTTLHCHFTVIGLIFLKIHLYWTLTLIDLD